MAMFVKTRSFRFADLSLMLSLVPMAFQAVLALLTSAMLFVMPESPRYLFQWERSEEAQLVLRALYTRNGTLDEQKMLATVTEITEAIAIESNQATWTDLVKSDEVHSRRRVILACVLNACQAWSGSTPVSYYTTFM